MLVRDEYLGWNPASGAETMGTPEYRTSTRGDPGDPHRTRLKLLVGGML